MDSDMDVMVLVNCTKEKAINYRKQISRLASRLGLENDIEIWEHSQTLIFLGF